MVLRSCLVVAVLSCLPLAPAVLAAPASPGASAGTAAAAPVDVNAASVDQLVAVPGIGKSLAQRIVDFRQKNGPFKSVDELLKVQGIGEKSLEKLRPHLVVRSK